MSPRTASVFQDGLPSCQMHRGGQTGNLGEDQVSVLIRAVRRRGLERKSHAEKPSEVVLSAVGEGECRGPRARFGAESQGTSRMQRVGLEEILSLILGDPRIHARDDRTSGSTVSTCRWSPAMRRSVPKAPGDGSRRNEDVRFP